MSHETVLFNLRKRDFKPINNQLRQISGKILSAIVSGKRGDKFDSKKIVQFVKKRSIEKSSNTSTFPRLVCCREKRSEV